MLTKELTTCQYVAMECQWQKQDLLAPLVVITIIKIQVHILAQLQLLASLREKPIAIRHVSPIGASSVHIDVYEVYV